MKSRLCQIISWVYDNLGRVSSGKRSWQFGTPVAGQQFEYAFDDLRDRETACRSRDHAFIPNSGTFIATPWRTNGQYKRFWTSEPITFTLKETEMPFCQVASRQ